MSKYSALNDYLRKNNKKEIILTFKEIENIIEDKLPTTAYNNPSWWGNDEKTHVQGKSWIEAGYKAKDIKRDESIRFVRVI